MSPTPFRCFALNLLWLLVACSACAQDVPAPVPAAITYAEFPRAAVESTLDDYQVKSLTTRRFKQADLQPLLQSLPAVFSVDTAGFSVEGRPLYRVEYGTGPVEVLL